MTSRQATRTRQKYKDSCTHCAGAKVRCSKEKPQCMRCNERGLECSYGLSYRYGRLPARTKLNAAGYMDQAVVTAPATPRELLPNGSRTPSPTSDASNLSVSWLNDSPMAMPNTASSALNGCLGLGYDSSTAHNFMAAAYDTGNGSLQSLHGQPFQSLNPSPDSIASSTAAYNAINYIQCLDSLPQPTTRRDHSRSISSVSSLPSAFDYSVAGFPSASPLQFGTPPETPRASVLSSFGSSQHDCLLQATTVLLSLRAEPLAAPGRNRDLMDQILNMTECDCFVKDSHQRMFLILIAFEVMKRYSMNTRDNRSVASTEIIIEELQAVLKLVERILKRLRDVDTGTASQVFSPDSPTGQFSSETISCTVFNQLEADLRKQLRGISHSTVDILRHV
ncbi:hypothetical protein F5Y16DRAFT_43117 [Xylariaceae sp. FL0255]|nr:hypothetical protein F5Y16DRAFT_43117 [Xylariaceae sp. FL0255]